MADGKVVIDVLLDDGKVVKGVANINKGISGIGGTAKSAAASIGKIATAVGAVYLVKKAFDMVKSSMQRAFGRIDTMEQFGRVMTTMTGSARKADDILKTINDTVTGTAYGLDVGARAVQNFVTSNMKVDKATDTLAAWGDAVSFYGDGSNATFESVSRAIAQMVAKGKVQMDNMNIFTEAGIPAMQIYADATGQSVEAVAKQMEKGELDANKFIDVMNNAFNKGTKNFAGIKGAAKEAGASWGGTFDNMQAAVARGVTAIIDSIDQLLIANGLPDMRELIAAFGKQFENALKKVADGIIAVSFEIPKLIEKFKSVKEALEPWMPLILAIVAGIASFAGTIGIMAGVVRAFEGVKKSIEGIKFAFFALRYVLATNPFALIVAAVVVAVVLIYKYWEPIKAFFIKLWDSIKTAGIVVWTALKTAWKSAVDFLKSAWQGIKDFFVGIWDGIKSGASTLWDTVVAAWTAYIETLKAIWTPVLEFFVTIWEGIKTGALFIWDVVVAAWTSFVEIIKAIWAPIVNFFANIWSNIVNNATTIWDTVVTALQTIWTNIQTAAQAAWEIIKNVILGPILLLIDLVTGNMESFKSHLSQIWSNIKAAAQQIWDALKNIVSTIVKTTISILKSLWEGAKSNLQNIWNTIKSIAQSVWNGIKTFFSTVTNAIVNFIKTSWNNIKTNTTTIFNAVRALITAIWNGIKSFLSNTVKAIFNFVKSSWNNIKSSSSSIFNSVRAMISSIWNGIKTFFTTTLSNIVSSVKQKFTDMLNTIRSKMNEVKSKIQTGWNAALSFLKGINLASIGKDIIQGLINGIKSKIEAVKNAIKSVTSAITGKIKSILDIHSPSRVMIAIGKFIGDGLAIGMEKMIPANQKVMQQMGQVIIKTAKNNGKEIQKVHRDTNASITKEKKKLAAKLKEVDKQAAQQAEKARATVSAKRKGSTAAAEKRINQIYSDARSKREKLIKASNDRIASLNQKAKKDTAKIQAKSQKEKLDAIKLFVEDKASLDRLSLQDEVAIWGKAVKQFKKGTKERVEAQKNYNKAVDELNNSRLQKEKDFVEKNKKLNKLSLYDELKLYEAYASNYKKGTEQRQYWDEQVLDAKKRINDEMIAVNEEYSQKMQDINEKLIENEKKLNEEYQKALDDRTKALYSFSGIFDEIQNKDVSGWDLLENLQGQVDTFEDWANNIQRLAEKGIDEGLLAELREMGPKAAAEIKGLTQLSDTQLDQYVLLWKRKNEQARTQATAELAGMKEDTSKQIQELRAQAEKDLYDLQTTWFVRIREIRIGSLGEFNPMVSSLKQIGQNSIKGMINGLESMEGALMKKAQAIADSVKRVMQTTFDIHSPSRWMRDMIGKNMIKGWIGGIDRGKNLLLKKAEQMTGWMKPEVPVINRLRGVTAPIGNVRPIRAANTGDSGSVSHDNSKTFAPNIQNYFTPAESTPSEAARKQKQMLRKLGMEL